jgi:hypothetical protein
MVRLWRLSVMVIVPTFAPMQAWAAQVWVLWVETPIGSDQRNIVSISKSRFTAMHECERQAQKLNEFEIAMAKMERIAGDSRDLFTCLPDAVDPRPEGALR